MIKRANFKGTINNQSVDLYTLENSNGLKAGITNYGARLVELQAPDKDGNTDNLIIGYTSIPGFRSCENYFGAIIGRYANRISNARFSLDGTVYKLEANEGSHHLHGGRNGFHNAIWGSNQIDQQTLHLSHQSTDGEGGYPGNLGISVTYTLTDKNELKISYQAESDDKTILNVTNHAYFNLCGTSSGAPVYDHHLKINSDKYTPVDETLIPTGELAPVADTPLDFRKEKPIGVDRSVDHPELTNTDGYDHNFVLNKESDRKFSHAARVREPDSRRQLDVFTDQPGLQFYECRNPLENIHSAFCLETQHFPDSPNNPGFPAVVLNPFETFKSSTVYRFTCY